jgi:dihydrofolate reductase
MGRIIITTNASLDGVVEDPDGKEGTAHGGWFTGSDPADLEAWTALETEESMQASALLLGRRSDAWFAERWLPRTGAWPDRLNGLPKYVVSSTLDEPRWSNATVLRGIEDVAAAKRQVDGEILVFASYELIRALLSQGLVDELRLIVFPVVLGGGKRLFGEPADRVRLVETRAVGTGLVFLRYLTR